MKVGGTARRPALGILCALLLALGAAARADSLRAEFSPLTLRPRTNAPAIFDIQLHRQGAGVLEGVLEITLEGGGGILLRQSTQELALAAGTQAFRILTPPLPPHESYTGTEARLRFVTKTAAVDLGRFPAGAASRGTRNFVIAVGDGGTAGQRTATLWPSLRLEDFFPAPANADRLITTSPAYLAPEDFSANPLAFFAFDLVLLEGDGFALLREKQLTALTRWVEAGGSLCVLPGRGLKDEHANFLRGFANGKTPAWRITETGEWLLEGRAPQLLRAGLGHVVLASLPPAEARSDVTWRRASAFLWKMRGATSEAFFSRSQWAQAADLRDLLAESRRHAEELRTEMERSLQKLLPQSTQLIAPATLALILAGFLLVVGPLDWFTLGLLRRRRWTWIVFPLACAGCTALVIFEAGRALGHQDHHGALIISDVGPGGRVLREIRYELLFTARNQDSATEMHNAFVVPATHRGGHPRMPSSNESTGPVWYSGLVPARYTLRQQLRQWTPQFRRVTSLEASADASGIPWAEIETSIVQNPRPKAGAGQMAKSHPGHTYQLLHAGRDWVFSSKWLPGSIGSVSSRNGLREFHARSSPTGADDFDDLQLLDTEDPHEWVLLIYRETPAGVHLYRRLFRTDD